MDSIAPKRRPAAPPALGLPPRRLDIAVFGAVRISTNGREVPLKSRRARAVLAYLALSEGCGATRERLCGLFWGDASTAQAQNSLRQIVRELNVALDSAGYRGLRCTRLSLSLDPATLRVDLWDVLAEVRQGQVHQLLLANMRATETLFAGFDDFEGAFLTWLRARQQTMHDLLIRELGMALNLQGATPTVRQRLAQAMVNLDPANEAACRALMQARAELGDIAGALRAYDALQKLLSTEHGVPPADATVALLEAIKAGRFDPPAQPTTSNAAPDRQGLPNQPSVSALPSPWAAPVDPPPAERIGVLVARFACDGVPEDRAHLVGGFRHDLIACLVRFRDWTVVDGGTASAGSGAMPPPRYVLSTTAHAEGDTVRMILTLQERETGVYVWSEHIAIQYDDWFPTQQRIVGRIAASLNLQVGHEQGRPRADPPDMPAESYDLWRRGQALLGRYEPELWNDATALFEAAIRAAPGFSPAYTSLAQMDNTVHVVHPGVTRDPAKLAQALENARHAASLDQRDSRALVCLGWTLASNKRFEEAAIHMRVARDLNRNDISTLMSVALFKAYTGQAAQARDLSRQAFEISPLPSRMQWTYEALIMFMIGDDEACLTACDHAQDVIPLLSAFRAAALHHLGRTEEAGAEARRFLAQTRARWLGATPATDAAIGRWLLHQLPISRADLWERFRIGVTGAGIPDGGLRFGEW